VKLDNFTKIYYGFTKLGGHFTRKPKCINVLISIVQTRERERERDTERETDRQTEREREVIFVLIHVPTEKERNNYVFICGILCDI
jgi:hypothetical protein